MQAFQDMQYKRCPAEACLYFSWTMFGLILWVSWVDDCLVAGNDKGVQNAKRQLMERFNCDETGTLEEYVSCKLLEAIKIHLVDLVSTVTSID